VLTFFIAGLLYLLRFKRVDNLGAYSIPSETGLLISSVFDSLVTNDCHRANAAGTGELLESYDHARCLQLRHDREKVTD
jgi:hypothetical protein